MFLVSDSSASREKRIQQLQEEDPSLAALMAVIHCEWTMRRAIIAMGSSPNIVIRSELRRSGGGLKGYKDCWKAEVFPKYSQRLTEVIQDWQALQKTFKLRNQLVHGISACKPSSAINASAAALTAAQDVRVFCAEHSIDLDQRLPIRQRPKQVQQAA